VFKWLDIDIKLEINQKNYNNIPYSVKNDNYLSFIIAKCMHFKNVSLSNNDQNLEVLIEIYSNKLNLKYTLSTKLKIGDIKTKSTKGKIFNVYLAENLVLAFFDGDTNL
jgi:hypothetical protein